FDRLSQLKSKRIAVGPAGSGTRLAADQILGKGGVNSETATLLPFAATAAVEALNEGKVDAVWTFGAPDGTAVHSLLTNPNVRLMSFPNAEAFTIIFPGLVRLELPRDVIDIDRNIPANDMPLIGTTTKVLVRGDLHPEIVQLLLQTMVEVHGGRGIFQRSGEFPNSIDTEYPVAPAAVDFYKNGPSFYAEACALMAIRTRTKSDCGAGRRHSARPTNGPPFAAGLQLDHATASVLLVRPTQGFGGLVRRPDETAIESEAS